MKRLIGILLLLLVFTGCMGAGGEGQARIVWDTRTVTDAQYISAKGIVTNTGTKMQVVGSIVGYLLDADGKELARNYTWVLATLKNGESVPFSVSFPKNDRAAKIRLVVVEATTGVYTTRELWQTTINVE